MADKTKSINDLTPPDEFYKIINDFTNDIAITFPEYSGIISKWWNRLTDNHEQSKHKETIVVFRHCVKIFPERFFDILYKNTTIFAEDSETNTEFLPGIVFRQLWACDISDKTRETLWKYLQLILFSVIGCVHNKTEWGDAAKLFEAIDEDELKKKLQETLESMQNLFDASGSSVDGIDASLNGIKMENIPNAQELHEHIHSMMGGKLGKIAMELAEETAANLNLDMENVGNVKDVFQQLFKEPAKLMNMVKTIGTKLNDKIQSGELKETELIQEGMDFFDKMKNTPGMPCMDDISKMFSNMGMPGLGKGSKLNVGAMEANLNRNMKTAKTKERIRAKAMANAAARATSVSNVSSATFTETKPQISEEEILAIFSTGEKVEKTPRGAKPPVSTKNLKKNKKR